MLLPKILSMISFAFLCTAIVSQDTEGCKDHPLFPIRVPHYYLSECSAVYDSIVFDFPPAGMEMRPQQGIKSFFRYDFNFESMEQKPQCPLILQTIESTAASLGTISPFAHRNASIRIWKLITPSGDIAWIKVECGGDEDNDFYNLTIIERVW